MTDLILQYLLSLSTTVVLPAAIWIIACSRIFTRLRIFSPSNYQEGVRETVCDTAVGEICQLIHQLFSQYDMTVPISDAALETIVWNLITEAPDRLTAISTIYQSLVESGIQSPFFEQVVRAILALIGGG